MPLDLLNLVALKKKAEEFRRMQGKVASIADEVLKFTPETSEGVATSKRLELARSLASATVFCEETKLLYLRIREDLRKEA